MILSSKTQAKVIADLLDCKEVQVDADSLTEPWRTYYDWILQGDEDESPSDRWSDFLQEFLGYKGNEENQRCCALIREVHEGISRYPTADEILVSLPDLKWLWEKWIPRGLLTLLVAEPGLGKSYLDLDLAHRIIAGTEYPDGTPVGEPGRVLYVEAEYAPQILKKRLTGWTSDELRRLSIMSPAPDKMMIDLNQYDDRDRLLDMVYQVRPELVIVDSYGAVTLKGEKAKEEAQRLLAFLTRIAVDYDCAMKLIHHPRKKSRIQLMLPSVPMALDAVRGTSYLVQIARLVMVLEWIQVGPELDRNGPRRLQVIKSNLDVYPEPIGVWFDSMIDDPSVAKLRYGDAPEPYRELSKLEKCMVWLMDVLGMEGPTSLATLVEWADDEGYSKVTICRARKRLEDDIIDTKGPYQKDNLWALAETYTEEV